LIAAALAEYAGTITWISRLVNPLPLASSDAKNAAELAAGTVMLVAPPALVLIELMTAALAAILSVEPSVAAFNAVRKSM
jgi:hypothetical protein